MKISLCYYLFNSQTAKYFYYQGKNNFARLISLFYPDLCVSCCSSLRLLIIKRRFFSFSLHSFRPSRENNVGSLKIQQKNEEKSYLIANEARARSFCVVQEQKKDSPKRFLMNGIL